MPESGDPPAAIAASRTTAEKLWTATERLRALEEASPVGIIALDMNGRVTIWNHAAEQLFGWQTSEVCGRPYRLIPIDRQAADRALVARVVSGEVVLAMETSHFRKDGSEIAVSLSCGPILDPDGGVCGTIRVLTDLTETNRLSGQLLQSQKMDAFGQLAGGIAHDFNNLLTVINGFSELVLESVQHLSVVATDVQEIKDAGERAAQLTRQLLSFSRMQARVPQVVNLAVVVDHFETMLRRIVRENITLQIAHGPLLGRTRADAAQIEQLVMNLVVNAADAMPDGGVLTITTGNVDLDAAHVQRHPGALAGRYVSLAVADSGTGMPAEVLARACDPFFTTKKPGKGTGLGLSTVSGLVEQYGGHVTIDSTPGVGTVVTTFWPTVDDALTESMPPPKSSHLRGSETILLVEDDTGVRHLMERVLERYGYTVLPARDADEAIAVELRHKPPIQLLVTDVIMPGLGGAGLAQFIIERRPGMQVLFVSGHASREAIDKGMNSAYASFLQKPFNADILARAVRDRLDRAANSATAAQT